MQLARQKQFRLNLADLHAVCEANYARLLRLFPEYETANTREFNLGSSRVTIEVVERCRYTTIFRIVQKPISQQPSQQHKDQQHKAPQRERQAPTEAPWLGSIRAEVRAYHDATMLEVGSFQSHRHIQARYQYPNNNMYQQDEKCQQNRFLADWLEHCIQSGRSNYSLCADASGR